MLGRTYSDTEVDDGSKPDPVEDRRHVAQVRADHLHLFMAL